MISIAPECISGSGLIGASKAALESFSKNAVFAASANDVTRCLRRSIFPAKYVQGRAVNVR